MPPREYTSVPHDFNQNIRTVSPSNSISSSIHGSDIDPDQPKLEQQNRSESIKWSVLVPVIGMTIMTWAQKANARVRQHATACCTGDFCVGNDTNGTTIPEEISFQKCKNQRRQSVDSNNPAPSKLTEMSKTAVELTTFEASSVVGTDMLVGERNQTDDGYDASWTVPHPIRRTKWNEIPDDPVDEVSLKGSSMYMSDDEDDVEAVARSNMDDDHDDESIYNKHVQQLHQRWAHIKKLRKYENVANNNRHNCFNVNSHVGEH